MATLNELETKLRELNEGLNLVDDKFKAGIRKQIAQTEKDIESMKGSESPAPAPTNSDPFIQSVLSTIATTMASGEGTGIDTPQVREIIKKYLRDDKVKLAELDKSILEEIKRNQSIVLEIPAFAKKIEVSSTTARIPNF